MVGQGEKNVLGRRKQCSNSWHESRSERVLLEELKNVEEESYSSVCVCAGNRVGG